MGQGLKVNQSWKAFFQQEQQKPYFQKLMTDIKYEYKNYQCFPNWENIFQIFAIVPVSAVKVVILGQDPYHQPNQAHGLAFSVLPGVKIPPSLKNIFQELKTDLNIDNQNNGYLVPWAKEGVFLLNTSLTVRANQPNSHNKYQWEIFTDAVLQYLNDTQNHLVFILWGNNAIAKLSIIDQNKHLVVKSAHPSPLSVHRGFFGSKPFSQTNNWLVRHNLKPIDWFLSDRTKK